MRPLLIGGGERRLFAIYTPAEGERLRRGAVICPSVGQEYLRAHRSCVLLDRQLARRGVDVLRFDYYGSGDSAGDAREVTLAGAVDDTVQAVRELRDVAAIRPVALIGLRVGAAVAARAAGPASVGRVVLWDPVVDGHAFVDELTRDSEPLPDDPEGAHCQGFPYPGSLLHELRSLSAETFAELPPAALLALSTETEAHRRLGAPAASGSGAEGDARPAVERVLRLADPSWLERGESGTGTVPTELLREIVEWVA